MKWHEDSRFAFQFVARKRFMDLGANPRRVRYRKLAKIRPVKNPTGSRTPLYTRPWVVEVKR